MRDLAQRMQHARDRIATTWSDERASSVGRALVHRRQARRRRRAALLVASALAVVLCIFFLRRERSAGERFEATATHLDDGSLVGPVGDEAVFAVREVTPERVTVGVSRGRVRCDVHPNPARVFRVEAGTVLVEVLGTAFSVERLANDDVRVDVERGRVRVSAPGRTRDLRAGEGEVFVGHVAPPAPSADVPAPTPTGAVPIAEASSLPNAPRPEATGRGWKKLAAEGAFDDAYDAVRHEGGSRVVRDDVEDLLLYADVARHSHHPAEAVEPLQRISSKHRTDPRASLAAFTLGRVLLDELGRPSEAAAAFADARALQPDGALAEDALAREVEASSRAGDTAKAHGLAELYLTRYPHGARSRLVRRHGGLE